MLAACRSSSRLIAASSGVAPRRTVRRALMRSNGVRHACGIAVVKIGSGRLSTSVCRGLAVGWPKWYPWPAVAPSARAYWACSAVSIPSARIVAPVRSACAPTAPAIAAISGVGCSCTNRRSSLITSGRNTGINANDRVSAPTSSNAIPHPAARARSTAGNNSGNRLVNVRSVNSTIPRTPCPIGGNGPNPTVSGSAFTNNVNGPWIP